jgi:hypothetical protein
MYGFIVGLCLLRSSYISAIAECQIWVQAFGVTAYRSLTVWGWISSVLEQHTEDGHPMHMSHSL